MKWIILAAEQGDAHAQNNLGIIHRNGHGTLQATPNDYVLAAEWFRRAAEQGHPGAQHSLGVMCGAGEGIRQNRVQAYMWLSLAVARSHGANRELSVQARDGIAAAMSSAQITRATRLARQWREKVETPPPC